MTGTVGGYALTGSSQYTTTQINALLAAGRPEIYKDENWAETGPTPTSPGLIFGRTTYVIFSKSRILHV